MTFTLKHALTNNVGDDPGEDFCHDSSDKIYFIDYDGSDINVYEISISTDTVTKISETASFSGVLDTSLERGPVFFGGKVYLMTEDISAKEIYVYEWTGSGTTWTLRDTIAYTTFTSSNGVLAVVGSQIVAIVTDEALGDGTFTTKVRYSSNGSTWNTGSIDAGATPPSATYNEWTQTIYNPANNPNGLWLLKYQDDATNPLRFLYDLFKWDGNSNFDYTSFTYEKDFPSFTGNDWLANIFLTDILNWYNSGTNEYEETTLTGTQAATNNSSVTPVRTVGFTTKSIGYQVDGGALKLHILDPVGTWDSGEQVGSLTDGRVLGVVRFNNGENWVFARNGDGTTRNLYKNDSLIADAGQSSSIASFYYGVNELVERSDLPFADAAMRGMAIDKFDNLVVPNADANAYMIALGVLEQLYTQWRDISYDIDKTNGLKVLRWV